MKININNININYEVMGDGEPVILLHGWGCNVTSMISITNFLKNKYKVYILDFPGESGGSDLPNIPWGVPEYSEMVKSFIEKLNIEKPNVIGHSFGGRIIIYLASKYKDLFNKIILTDSAGIKPKKKIKSKIRQCSYKFARKILSITLSKEEFEKWSNNYREKHGSADYKALKSDVMRESFKKIISLDLTKNLSDIERPTLLIWGENDADTPLYMGKIMEQKIKDSGLIVLKDAKHFSYIDKINEYNIIVENFLSSK